jgi:sensor domain DACNV-containing protein
VISKQRVCDSLTFVRLNSDSYPKDLSAKVAVALRRRKLPVPPSEGLDRLFEVLFFASIKADELRTTTVSIIVLDPAAPDPSPPRRIRQDRWSYIPLGDPLELSAGVLSKLAQATDPRSSSLAIWFKNARPYVWGLIDQQNGFFDFINYESESGPERPGLFQAVVTSPGWVTVYRQYERLAELRISTISSRQPNVLWRGPVYTSLQAGIARYIGRVGARLRQDDRQFRITSDDRSNLTSSWLQALSRLLIRTKPFTMELHSFSRQVKPI